MELFLYKTKQYQRWGIGELDVKDQQQLDLKYQQAPPLESAGMPHRLGLTNKDHGRES